MTNKTGKGGFKEHPEHIWKKGTPENFGEFRSLAVAIANEKAKGTDKQPLIIDGHAVTVSEAILRQWLLSGDFKKQLAAIQYAFGKPPDVINGDQEGGPVVIKIKGKMPDENV